MFESEVNSRTESGETLPERVIEDLRSYRQELLGRSVLAWGEHCTECVWPSCYSTCSLYEARADGACRQFVGGGSFAYLYLGRRRRIFRRSPSGAGRNCGHRGAQGGQ